MCAHERACDRRSSREARSSRLRRTSRGVGSILLLVTPMLFAACAKDSTKPGTYTLTGRVRLVGALRNAVGRTTAREVARTASGAEMPAGGAGNVTQGSPG